MACCAFAIFVLSQLLAPFVAMRTRLFGAREIPNAAVAWSLTDPPMRQARKARRPKPRWRTALYVAVGLEVAFGVAAFATIQPTRDTAWVAAAAFDGAWCRGIVDMIRGKSDGNRSE